MEASEQDPALSQHSAVLVIIVPSHIRYQKPPISMEMPSGSLLSIEPEARGSNCRRTDLTVCWEQGFSKCGQQTGFPDVTWGAS